MLQMRNWVSYQLLYNKLPQHLAAQNNSKHLLSHDFCGSGIWGLLSCVAPGQTLWWGCGQDVGQGCSSLKAWLGWRTHFQESSRRRLTSWCWGCWPKASTAECPSPHKSLHEVFSVSLQYGWGLSQSEWSKRKTEAGISFCSIFFCFCERKKHM